MGVLISALGNFLGGASVAQFIAFKLLLYSLIVVALPIILWNVMAEWSDMILSMVIGLLPQDSFIYELTGFSGWLAINLSLPEAVGIVISGLATRLIITTFLRV